MAELLPENLSLFTVTEADQSTSKTQRRVVTNIVEWLQYFSTYIVIVSYKQPHRVSDLLGYQHLIIQASQDYEGDSWLGYDRRFRQQVAASPSNSWARTDSSLWNQFFSGRAHTICCSHCFSHSHPLPACSLVHNRNQHSNQGQFSSCQSTFSSRQPVFQQRLSSTLQSSCMFQL